MRILFLVNGNKDYAIDIVRVSELKPRFERVTRGINAWTFSILGRGFAFEILERKPWTIVVDGKTMHELSSDEVNVWIKK